jgi:hypothetical protein
VITWRSTVWIWKCLLFKCKGPRTAAIVTPPRPAWLRRSYKCCRARPPQDNFLHGRSFRVLSASNIKLSMDSIPPSPIDSFKFTYSMRFPSANYIFPIKQESHPTIAVCVTVANAVFPLFGMKEGSGAAGLKTRSNTTCEMTVISQKSLEWGETLQLTRVVLGDHTACSPREPGFVDIFSR